MASFHKSDYLLLQALHVALVCTQLCVWEGSGVEVIPERSDATPGTGVKDETVHTSTTDSSHQEKNISKTLIGTPHPVHRPPAEGLTQTNKNTSKSHMSRKDDTISQGQSSSSSVDSRSSHALSVMRPKIIRRRRGDTTSTLSQRARSRREFTALSRKLTGRCLSAVSGLNFFLETVNTVADAHFNVAVLLFRTWPGVSAIVPHTTLLINPPVDEIMAELLRFRARALYLAGAPACFTNSLQAAEAYLFYGEKCIKTVIEFFISGLDKLDRAVLEDFRHQLLPVLLSTLEASALMFRRSHTKPVRLCLELLGRRVQQLETLGKIGEEVGRRTQLLASER